MKISKPTVWVISLALAALVSGSLWLNHRHQVDKRLAIAHLIYQRHCSGCVQGRVNFQIDLFGDGTVIFQQGADSDGRSYLTHIDAHEAAKYLQKLDTDAYWREAPVHVGGVDGSYCHVAFIINGLTREGGCAIETTDANGNISLIQDHPQIAKLEALTGLERLKSLDRANLPADVTIYQPSARYAVEPWSRTPPPPPPPAG